MHRNVYRHTRLGSRLRKARIGALCRREPNFRIASRVDSWRISSFPYFLAYHSQRTVYAQRLVFALHFFPLPPRELTKHKRVVSISTRIFQPFLACSRYGKTYTEKNNKKTTCSNQWNSTRALGQGQR